MGLYRTHVQKTSPVRKDKHGNLRSPMFEKARCHSNGQGWRGGGGVCGFSFLHAKCYPSHSVLEHMDKYKPDPPPGLFCSRLEDAHNVRKDLRCLLDLQPPLGSLDYTWSQRLRPGEGLPLTERWILHDVRSPSIDMHMTHAVVAELYLQMR